MFTHVPEVLSGLQEATHGHEDDDVGVEELWGRSGDIAHGGDVDVQGHLEGLEAFVEVVHPWVTLSLVKLHPSLGGKVILAPRAAMAHCFTVL